tara:strand:+ start:49 stop:864 length:816 start_codon:yes stop_codon:yes gene_type:complete
MKISLLGCGWLGTALLKPFSKEGHDVIVSTRSEIKKFQFQQQGTPAVVLNLPDCSPHLIPSFWESDVMIITVPFKRSFSDPTLYKTQIESIMPELKKHRYQKIIFTSSTSVYPLTDGDVDENTPIDVNNPRSKVLSEVEQLILSCPASLVLRFGGLFGPNREPNLFLKQAHQLDYGMSPVNLIHLEDCVAIITKLINSSLEDSIYNVVATKHPTKKEFYNHILKYYDLPILSFKDNKKKYKIVSNFKLLKDLKYQFRYPDPRDAYDITKKS